MVSNPPLFPKTDRWLEFPGASLSQEFPGVIILGPGGNYFDIGLSSLEP